MQKAWFSQQTLMLTLQMYCVRCKIVHRYIFTNVKNWSTVWGRLRVRDIVLFFLGVHAPVMWAAALDRATVRSNGFWLAAECVVWSAAGWEETCLLDWRICSAMLWRGVWSAAGEGFPLEHGWAWPEGHGESRQLKAGAVVGRRLLAVYREGPCSQGVVTGLLDVGPSILM